MFTITHTGKISDKRINQCKETIATAPAKFEQLALELKRKPLLYLQMEVAGKITRLNSEVKYAQNQLKIAEKINQIKIFKAGSLTKFKNLENSPLCPTQQ